MLLLAGCLFFIAEVVAFVAVGEHIGFGWTVLLLIGVSALGPFLVGRVGLGVLARTRDRLARGELPTRELLDGVVVLGGGALVCVPGFIGDALGLLLLIAPVRHVLIRVGGRRMARHVQRMGPARWNFTDVRTSRTYVDVSMPTDPTQAMIEPGRHREDPPPNGPA